MTLTKEEKNRIYEEEKVRLEAQEKLKNESKLTFKEILQAVVSIVGFCYLGWVIYQLWFVK